METEKPIWLFIFIHTPTEIMCAAPTLTSVKLQKGGKRGVTLCTSIIVDAEPPLQRLHNYPCKPKGVIKSINKSNPLLKVTKVHKVLKTSQ